MGRVQRGALRRRCRRTAGSRSRDVHPAGVRLRARRPDGTKPGRDGSGGIVERCFVFALPVDWDVRIWVETPREVCLQRGIARDLMPAERVRRVWSQVWQPAEDTYIAEHRPQDAADLVIDGTVAFAAQVS